MLLGFGRVAAFKGSACSEERRQMRRGDRPATSQTKTPARLRSELGSKLPKGSVRDWAGQKRDPIAQDINFAFSQLGSLRLIAR